jgi:hypothetical protein
MTEKDEDILQPMVGTHHTDVIKNAAFVTHVQSNAYSADSQGMPAISFYP